MRYLAAAWAILLGWQSTGESVDLVALLAGSNGKLVSFGTPCSAVPSGGYVAMTSSLTSSHGVPIITRSFTDYPQPGQPETTDSIYEVIQGQILAMGDFNGDIGQSYETLNFREVLSPNPIWAAPGKPRQTASMHSIPYAPATLASGSTSVYRSKGLWFYNGPQPASGRFTDTVTTTAEDGVVTSVESYKQTNAGDPFITITQTFVNGQLTGIVQARPQGVFRYTFCPE